MTRRTFRLLIVSAAVLLAMVGAPALAHAQDVDPDNPAPTYPGPFGTDDGDTSDDSDDADGDTADEVLGETLDASTSSDGVQPINERSIDYIGDDAGSYFAAPDIQPSADGAAVGGTGAGSSGLAATGSDVEPIIAMSVGLLAVGGSVLVGSRRRLRDFFS